MSDKLLETIESEPLLRIERIGNHVDEVLKKDSISCIAVHCKFLAIGTCSGKIHIVDHQGNCVQERLSQVCLHTTAVNSLSIEPRGEYVASASQNKVIIFGLYTNDCNNVFNFDTPVHCVAIDPNFCKSGSGRRLVTGDERVLLHEKTFLARYKSTLLHEDFKSGQVKNMKWRGNFVAFTNDTGIRIFDMDERNVICFIPKEANDLPTNLLKYSFSWKSNYEFVIGYGHSIKSCQVTKRKIISSEASSALPSKQVIIPTMCNIKSIILGIAPIDNNIVVLGYKLLNNQDETVMKENSETQLSHEYDLQIIEPLQDDYEEISSDTVAFTRQDPHLVNDFSLEYLSEDGMYFVVGPKDLLMATPKEDDERITWLIERKYFDEALDLIRRSKNARNHTVLSVGKIYMSYLLDQNDKEMHEKAGKLCKKILAKDKEAWKEQIQFFIQKGRLKYLTPYIPIGDPILLDKLDYESILHDFLEKSAEGFLNLIKNWPYSLYDVQQMTRTLLQAYGKDPANKKLSEALAQLYIYDGKHEKAVSILLDIKAGDMVFDLIRNYQLNHILLDRLELLMSVNSTETAELLLERKDSIPVDFVVEKLKNRHDLLWTYLDKVVEKDGDLCAIHHDLLVSLYAQFTPQRLLPFLQRSNHYSLEKALEICEKCHLIPEVVYLLSRMGNSKEALKCIINRMSNIHYAIDFCKEHSDPELWEDLINYSLKKPQFISTLLKNVGTHVPDPVSFIRRIPEGVAIQELKESLLTILKEYRSLTNSKKERKEALVNNCFRLLDKLNREQKRGAFFSDTTTCDECSKKIFAKVLQQASDIIIFNCKHVFHKECLSGIDSQEIQCSICPPIPQLRPNEKVSSI